MPIITLAQAQAVIAGATAAAAERGIHHATVVVTDAGGAVRAAARPDAAPPFTIDVATAKARTAIGFGRATLKSGEVFLPNPSAVSAIGDATGGRFLPLGGGIVVLGEDGAVIGAVAVAGGAPDVDHAIAVAGVMTAGLSTQE